MKRPPVQYPIDAVVARRLDALERLIDAEYEGKPSVLEERTGIRMSQVGQWFSGYRALRENALRRLEKKTRKPEGWFDVQVSSQADDSLIFERMQFDALSPNARMVAEWFDKIPESAYKQQVLSELLQLLALRQAQVPPSVGYPVIDEAETLSARRLALPANEKNAAKPDTDPGAQ